MEHLRIFAEWTLHGVYDNGFFGSWDEYHNFMFDPEINLIRINVRR